MSLTQRPAVLVADIGGTHARFALAEREAGGEIRITERRELAGADYAALEDCLEAYLAGLAGARPREAAFGVACPVSGDEVRLTNRAWRFSQAAVRRRFDLERLAVANDFAALGYAIPALTRADWRALRGPDWPERLGPVISLVGAGTGLGVGAVVLEGGGARVLPGEGGHAGFAPQDALELEIVRRLTPRFGRVSNERLLSGPGLELIYQALAEIGGTEAAPISAPRIVAAALSGDDDLARQTAERFGLALGAVMGDIALIQGAGAVALAGGLAPRLIDFIDTPAVRARFEAKGRARDYMARIPIALIAHPDPALLGAARLLLA